MSWWMRRVCPLVFIAIFAAPISSAGEPGARAEYVGGTRSEIPGNCTGSLQVIDEQYFVFYAHKTSIRVPYSQINLLEYGQKVDHRYVMAVLISPLLLISKKRQHFLTVGYTDEHGQEQALIFKVDKGHIRDVLVSLEARTGRRVEYQDEEARKAGKG